MPKKWGESQLTNRVPIDDQWTQKLHVRADGAICAEWQMFLPLTNETWTAGGTNYYSSRSSYYDQSKLDRTNEKFIRGITKRNPATPGHRSTVSKGLSGIAVYDALSTRWGVWLCTNAGVSLVTANGELIANYDRQHGLLCNSATSVCEVDGKVYFACGQSSGGGLVIFDPETGLFTTLKGTDGLASRYVDKLENVDGRIKITFAMYNAGSSREHYAPMFYDPKTRKFSKRSKNNYGRKPYKEKNSP